eukprot:TRINITY_DN12388_c0_g1_i3.p1 TRINITY_DN12388_c0_g1~~TRINITY_DN12388_c0_g1_i3.p1  ORF type:complete len:602 (+),score=118.62 TRINITY_DN12388_c0_g1_i3:414-2219(+)
MAPEIQPAKKPLEDMMRNLKVDPSSGGGNDNMAASRDGNPSDATSCISYSGDASSSVRGSDFDQESLMAEQGSYYPESSYCGYYYPGYDTLCGEWTEQGYFLPYDGLEMQYPVIQGDNGSVVCLAPGYQSGFNPYGSYVTGAMISVDGQYLTQYPYSSSPVIPQPLEGVPYTVPYGSELVPVWPYDPSMYVTATHGNGFVGAPVFTGCKPTFPSAPTRALSPPTKPTTHSKPITPLDTKLSPVALHVPSVTDTHSHSVKAVNKGAAVLSDGYCPIDKLPSYPNQGRDGFIYPAGPIDIKGNGQHCGGNEKIKASSKDNGVCDFDLLNDQNCGPKTSTKNASVPGADLVQSSGAEGNGNNNNSTAIIRRDQFNLPDFPTKYEHALFYVIKSYSEDDIHKSIKYGVWSSTTNGNKRLDSAYQDAHERTRERGSRCPVFLFFSVNASGQFCGVAEMIGRVDFNKNMDFWHQDKWNGFFHVKWHIIKDAPNLQFRHILLENNENKPVTNSRDTQEVKFRQGTEMLNIFKNYSSKTSIFDDFEFYESRQKAMQDKRMMQFAPRLEHYPQKADEGIQVVYASGHQSTELAISIKNKGEVKEIANVKG